MRSEFSACQCFLDPLECFQPRAARRSVLSRSPARRGISAGAVSVDD